MFAKDYVVLDLETTGLDSAKDCIIELGLARISQGEITEKISWLINPQCKIAKFVTELTGITNEMLDGKPLIGEVIPEIEKFILGAELVGHNISFDLGFLGNYISLQDAISYDTLALAKIFLPHAVNYTLGNLARELLLPINNLHRAGDDAELTAKVFLEIIKIVHDSEIDLLLGISKIVSVDLPIKNFIDLILKDKIKHSTVGSKKTFLRSLPLIPKPVRIEDEYYSIKQEEVIGWYGNNSPLAKDNLDFEIRQPQIDMAEAVIRAFNEKKLSIIEAGTGTGKSLAYLLPAAIYSQHSGKKVAIATNTISLQEQLLNKDIPQMEKLGINIRTVLMKGRSHYLCLRKLFSLDTFGELTHQDAHVLAKIYFWLSQTETGDKGELNYPPKAYNIWRMVATDSESCIGSKCKWYARQCFFWHARRNAELADIILINHALLLSDCNTERKILPEFTHLIIDEAHHLDKTASDHLGSQCDFFELSYFLQRIISTQKNEGFSVLGKIRKYFLSLSEQEKTLSAPLVTLIDDIYTKQCSIMGVIDNLKLLLGSLLNTSKDDVTEYRQTLRIKQELLNNPYWKEIFEFGSNLSRDVSKIALELDRLVININDLPNEIADKEQWQFEIANYIQFLRKCSATLEVFFQCDGSNEIKWLEYDGGFNNTFMIKYVPYNIGNIMKEALYDRCDTIVFTSATLTVDKKFDYYFENMGLKLVEERLLSLGVGTTFNYETQALVVVPSDIVNPQINETKFLNSVIEFIENVFTNVRGKCLVLFTSHKQLRYVYQNLNLSDDVLVLAQNISGPRQKILQSFTLNENVCLLGANTFWEGIDLPGNLLNLLIIVKLPFLPPTYPLLEAKVERAEEEGHNAFQKVTLPGAVIRFKQGFGRLIRRKDDKGVVVVLDGRVTSKKYGLSFLRSLPIKSFFIGSQDEVVLKLTTWLRDI